MKTRNYYTWNDQVNQGCDSDAPGTQDPDPVLLHVDAAQCPAQRGAGRNDIIRKQDLLRQDRAFLKYDIP